jgi:lysophospholipase L1-like esterase
MTQPEPTQPEPAGWRQRLFRHAAEVVALLVVAVVAIAVAIKATPVQTVNVAGQVVTVGTTAPSWSLSGPGEVDLFGQSLPTTIHFPGPLRPRLALSQISINSQLTNFVRGANAADAERTLGSRLADGWKQYFAWETAIAGLGALVLLGAVAGWRRLPPRTTIKLLVAGLLVTEAINVGAIIITASRAPALLRQVSSLNQLVGSAPPPQVHVRGRPLPKVQAVVMGDSTAAGEGLPVVTSSGLARVCGRSQDSYAQDLAAVNGWQVLNLACSGATIAQGLLGPQHRSGETIRPQLASAQRASNASVIIVNIGANDLGWATMVRYCAVAPRCDDKATTAYFQQQLASFSKNYLELLSQLATLPGHPRVIINQYYDPFGPEQTCLGRAGLTPAKLAILTSRLSTLNAVLAKGATEFRFLSPLPDFTGHQLCTSQPYVQWLGDPAPFHPTALGQLAIALTDQAALRVPVPPATGLR